MSFIRKAMQKLQGILPALLLLALAAVADIPTARAQSACVGTEVSRWVTSITYSDGTTDYFLNIRIRRSDGSFCTVVQPLSSSGSSSGSTSALNYQLVNGLPPARPPVGSGTSARRTQRADLGSMSAEELRQRFPETPLGLAEFDLAVAESALANEEAKLQELWSDYKKALAEHAEVMRTDRERRESIRETYNVNPGDYAAVGERLHNLQEGWVSDEDDDLDWSELYDYWANYQEHGDRVVFSRNRVELFQDQIATTIKSINDLKKDVAEIKQRVSSLRQGSNQQVKAGLPPDARPDWMNGISWWSHGILSSFDDNNPARTIDGVTGRVMVGGDLTLNEWLSVGFGIGTGASDMNVVGGTSDAVGVNFLARVAARATELIWFDAAATYAYSSVSERIGGTADDFDFNQFGLGGGINLNHEIAEDWRVDGRIGWFGVWSDGASVVNPTASTGDFGQARADARLNYLFNGGEVFAEGALRLVTNDSSGVLDVTPVDGELGGGLRFNLGDNVDLTGRGYTVVGRNAYREFGASLYLKGRF